MAQQRATAYDPVGRWGAAAIVTSLLLNVFTIPIQNPSELRESGALIGMPTYLGGVLHELVVTLIVMVVFAGLLSGTRLRAYTDRLGYVVAFGVGYGVVLWAVYFGVIMPLWARAVGVTGIPFPFFDLGFLVFHLGLGALIGGLYYGILSLLRGHHSDKPRTTPNQ